MTPELILVLTPESFAALPGSIFEAAWSAERHYRDGKWYVVVPFTLKWARWLEQLRQSCQPEYSG